MIKRIFGKRKTEFTCSQCGEIHDDWPALGFVAPIHYNQLEEAKQKSMASLDSDFCIIYDSEETYRFVRVSLHQKVTDYHSTLDYGLWVSLSEKSFKDYQGNFDNENHITTYFGWLCNSISPYEDTLSTPVDIHTNPGNLRPEIIPHHDHNTSFVRDFHTGISREEAERRIHAMLDNYL